MHTLAPTTSHSLSTMSTPARSYPKRSRQSTGAGTYPTARRPRRSAGTGRTGGGGVVITTENLGVAAQKWTKVYRAPMAPLEEPYFGSSASASFEVPTWVRVEDLTPVERARYDDEEKKKEAQRVIWRKELAEKAEEAEKAKKESQEGIKENEEKNDNADADVGTNDGKDEPNALQTEKIGDGAVDPAKGDEETSGDASKNETNSVAMEGGVKMAERAIEMTTAAMEGGMTDGAGNLSDAKTKNQSQQENQVSNEPDAPKVEAGTSEIPTAEAEPAPPNSQTDENEAQEALGEQMNVETQVGEVKEIGEEQKVIKEANAETPNEPSASEGFAVTAVEPASETSQKGGNENQGTTEVVKEAGAETSPATSQQDSNEELGALEEAYEPSVANDGAVDAVDAVDTHPKTQDEQEEAGEEMDIEKEAVATGEPIVAGDAAENVAEAEVDATSTMTSQHEQGTLEVAEQMEEEQAGEGNG